MDLDFGLVDKITEILNSNRSAHARLEITRDVDFACKNLEKDLYDLILLNITEQKDFLTILSHAREATSKNRNTPIVVAGLSEKFLKLGKSENMVYCINAEKGGNGV